MNIDHLEDLSVLLCVPELVDADRIDPQVPWPALKSQIMEGFFALPDNVLLPVVIAISHEDRTLVIRPPSRVGESLIWRVSSREKANS